MKLKQRVRQQSVRQSTASPQLCHQRPFATLFLALALGLALASAPLRAQPEGKDAAEAAPAATDGAATKPAATPAPPANSAPSPGPKSTGNSSPFDYRSSEEISEDVPVSFPVDI